VTDDNDHVVPPDNVGFMFNSNGEAFNLKENQGVEIAYDGTNYKTYTYKESNADTSNGEFSTMKDLRKLISDDAKAVSNTAVTTVTEKGKFKIDNSDTGGTELNIKVRAHVDSANNVTENTKFTTTMSALASVLPAAKGSVAFSQDLNAATHSSSIDIFDSLGTKHTLRSSFRKVSASKWDMTLSVPEPGEIDSSAPKNEKRGNITFNNDGSISQYNPGSISFTANNGSKPYQTVKLSFGTPNKFDGMTSFDSKSATSGISQDGYTGGDLVGIRIDQSGTLVGSFSNGRSFGLAQIAMAKFTNNEGLSSDGGNVYNQTANSGDPIIGTAATAGRGFIQSSALEASNVDLSRALTQLIIIQRGFQANGKTITTSDQLLQTLIGLKQ